MKLLKSQQRAVMQIFGDGPLKLAVVEVQPNLSVRATAKVVGALDGAQTLQRELDDLNRLLDQTKNNKKSSLAQLALIRNKISKRQALINGIAKQVKVLDDAILSNQKDVKRLNNELDTLKLRYAKSIVFAYQSRSGYEYLNFLFSAGSFNDAVKRITYLKRYRQNRETQAMAIGRYWGI